MADILLIQPPTSFTNKAINLGKTDYLLGLPYLAAVLKQEGLSFRALNDLDATYSIDDILTLCEAEKVKIVGISATTQMIRSAVKLAKAVKGRFGKSIHVALGGIHAALDPQIIERHPFFDSVVTGEAETFAPQFFRRILDGEPLSGVFKATPPADLDALPFPAFDHVENSQIQNGPTVPILGTRGCPHRCGYCCIPLLNPKTRHRSPSNITQEIRSRLPQAREFFFVDDAATVRRSHIASLCETILKERLAIRFYMITRLDYMDDELLALLKRAGCKTLLAGIESGNERIRNQVIGKRLTDETIFKALGLIKKHKIGVQLFFMIGHPGETKPDMLDSVNYPTRLLRAGFTNIEMVGFHLTIPYPKTPYFDWCVEHGGINPNPVDDYINDKLGDGFYGHWPNLIPQGVTLDEMERYRSLAHRKFYFRPRYIARRFLDDLLNPRQFANDIHNALSILRSGTASDKRDV